MEQAQFTFIGKPKNQSTEILYELLSSNGRISFRQMFLSTGIIGISQRISDLRRNGLQIICVEMNGKNKHGRKCSWGTWSIKGEEKKALEVYNKINK